jgi:acetamidase/formamidase
MLDFLMAATGLDIISAGMLCSLAVHLSVCQIVDPWKTVRGEIKISILEKYNWQKL